MGKIGPFVGKDETIGPVVVIGPFVGTDIFGGTGPVVSLTNMISYLQTYTKYLISFNRYLISYISYLKYSCMYLVYYIIYLICYICISDTLYFLLSLFEKSNILYNSSRYLTYICNIRYLI